MAAEEKQVQSVGEKETEKVEEEAGVTAALVEVVSVAFERDNSKVFSFHYQYQSYMRLMYHNLQARYRKT
jgi:hypothetical protein